MAYKAHTIQRKCTVLPRHVQQLFSLQSAGQQVSQDLQFYKSRSATLQYACVTQAACSNNKTTTHIIILFWVKC